MNQTNLQNRFGMSYAGGAPMDPIPTVFQFHLNLNSSYAPGGEFDTHAAFQETALPNAMSNTTEVLGISATIYRTTQGGGGFGDRESWYATSISDGPYSDAFMNKVQAAYAAWAGDLRAKMTARGDMLNVTMVFQPLTNPAFEAMQRNGGNALGLKPKEYPSYIVSVPTTWNLKANDDFVDGSVEAFVNQLDDMAKAAGFGHGYEYMNYSGKFQSKNGTVIASYGKENQERLREIAKKYDPNGQLRALWTGYHKP